MKLPHGCTLPGHKSHTLCLYVLVSVQKMQRAFAPLFSFPSSQGLLLREGKS